MPDPTRPVAGAPIATDWGQAVHDATFTPKGARVAGGASSGVGTANEQLNLNTAVDDPAGWLASDKLTVPTDAGGLYLILLRGTSQNGDDDAFTRLHIRRNGVEVARDQDQNDNATLVYLNLTILLELNAGDELTVYARNSEASPEPDVIVTALDVIRMGSEMGA